MEVSTASVGLMLLSPPTKRSISPQLAHRPGLCVIPRRELSMIPIHNGGHKRQERKGGVNPSSRPARIGIGGTFIRIVAPADPAHKGL